MRKAHRKITTHEMIRAHEMLKAHLIATRDGMVAYRGDWNDEKIAQAISPTLPRTSISRLRRELFGDLRRTANTRDSVTREEFDQMAAQVEDLKAELDRLYRRVEEELDVVL